MVKVLLALLVVVTLSACGSASGSGDGQYVCTQPSGSRCAHWEDSNSAQNRASRGLDEYLKQNRENAMNPQRP